MLYWIILVISGVCSCFSFFFAYQSYSIGGGGSFLFAGFGLFAGMFFIISATNLLSRYKVSDNSDGGNMTESMKPVSFVPHWFLMAALLITAIAILASILIPLILR